MTGEYLRFEAGLGYRETLSNRIPQSLGQVQPASLCFCYRDCFKAFYVHKFRAMLGKNRVIFPGEKVHAGPGHLAVSPAVFL